MALRSGGAGAGAGSQASVWSSEEGAAREGDRSPEDSHRFRACRPIDTRPTRGVVGFAPTRELRVSKLAPEAVIASAVLDRLVHHAHLVPIVGESYRMKNLRTPKRKGGAATGDSKIV